jgi:hypothetical protein
MHTLAKLAVVLALLPIGTALAYDSSATPSTNDANRTNDWAHVNQVDVGLGYTTLEFVTTRTFWSCFEYRTDGDTSQASGSNPNTEIDDGRYPYTCVNNSTAYKTLFASDYVEVRMVFGAEKDERFDWTPFEVLTAYSVKESTIDDLTDLLPDQDVEKAIARIEKSLDPNLWVDDNHLSDQGKKVFDEEKKAVKDLAKVVAPEAGLIVDTLIKVDEALAQIAIDEVVCNDNEKCEKELPKAIGEMDKAAEALVAQKPDKAIDHYKKAWEKAQKAQEAAEGM